MSAAAVGAEGIVAGIGIARHGALFLLVTVAATTDVAKGRIHDVLTLPATLLGFALHYAVGGWVADGWGLEAWTRPLDGFGTPCLLNALLGWGVGAGALFLLYMVGGMGGGDVKLMGAVGALGGFAFCLWALVLTSIAGAAMATGLLIWKGQLGAGLKRSAVLMLPGGRKRLAGAEGGGEDPARLTLPYGVAIAAGTVWIWFRTFT